MPNGERPDRGSAHLTKGLPRQCDQMAATRPAIVSKVPEVTLIFWIIKIFATTLGETGGDALSMSMNLGYLVSSAIFSLLFIVALVFQISSARFHPARYWLTIIATTTVGTTLADFADRSLGIGYLGGSAILAALLMLSFGLWYRSQGSVAVNRLTSPKSELFYWLTIICSQTLGTALGDWLADTAGLGYEGAALLFALVLGGIVWAYYQTRISHVVLFWAAFILTRPLGAVVGDFLDKPLSQGGLELSRYAATLSLLALMAICIYLFPQRPATNQLHG